MKKRYLSLIMVMFSLFVGGSAVEADKLIYSTNNLGNPCTGTNPMATHITEHSTYEEWIGYDYLHSFSFNEYDGRYGYPITYSEKFETATSTYLDLEILSDGYNYRTKHNYNLIPDSYIKNRSVYFSFPTGVYFDVPNRYKYYPSLEQQNMTIGFQGAYQSEPYLGTCANKLNGGNISEAGFSIKFLNFWNNREFKVVIKNKKISGDSTAYLTSRLGIVDTSANDFLVTVNSHKYTTNSPNETETEFFFSTKNNYATTLMVLVGCENWDVPVRFNISGIEIYDITDEKKVSEISVSPSEYSLTVGKSKLLYAKILPETAENKKVTWSSSDSSIVKVLSTGKVQAIRSGTATITATAEDGGYQSSSTITVK